MRKIEDGIEYCVAGDSKNNITRLPHYFGTLFQQFSKMGFNFGTMVLRKACPDETLTCYFPHHDKITGGVVFIPLTGFFWVAIDVKDNNDDSDEYRCWLESRDEEEKKQIGKFFKHKGWGTSSKKNQSSSANLAWR